MPGFLLNSNGDFVAEKGNLARDKTYASQVFAAIAIIKGSAPAFPEQGSDLFKIKAIGDDTLRKVEQSIHRALAGLMAQKKISEVDVTVTSPSPGRVDAVVSFRDLGGDFIEVQKRIL